VLGITAGLRQGEILGLKWEDIDLEEGVVRVRRMLTRDKGRLCCLANPRQRGAAGQCESRRPR
jgi:integrase